MRKGSFIGRLTPSAEGANAVEIKISTRHGSISDATREKVLQKVDRLVRYFDRLTGIEVTIDLERRDSPRVDLKVSAEHKHDFVATAEAGELLASLDVVLDKVKQQLRKYKQRIQERHRGTASREKKASE